MGDNDFLELSETSQNLDIDDDIGDLALDDGDITSQDGFEYPALLLTGVEFKDTLRVIQTCARPSYRAYDAWVEFEDGSSPVKIGALPFDLETLLVLRYLGVRVTAYSSEDNVELLDLSDTELLERCM